jgi:hypothetical protein
MNITLNWLTGGNAASQDVQYKLASSSTWITHSNVAGNVTTATISGLQDNLIYDFRVVTNCTGGTPAPSTSTQQINIICPSVSTTTTDTSVSYSFTNVGGSVTAYTVHLLDSTGNTVLQTQSPGVSGTVSGTFSTLTQSTSYKVRVTVVAGSFNKQCTPVNASTSATPVCNAPSNVSAYVVVDNGQGGGGGASSWVCVNGECLGVVDGPYTDYTTCVQNCTGGGGGPQE